MKTNTIFITILCIIAILSWNSTSGQGIPAREETGLDLVEETYDLSGEGVVVAFFDRGIDYFHPDFIDENGESRILFLYDMINPEGANAPNNPYGVGTIFSNEDLNASLAGSGDTLSMDRYGHGTATSGIATGNGSGGTAPDFIGVAPKAKLIVVKAVHDPFPPFGNQPGQEGFYNSAYIPIALTFIADKLDEIGLPGVALMNVGSVGGPTDGTSAVCQAMDDFVEQGHTLVCGVGDDGGNDNHASAFLSQDEDIELQIEKGETGNLRFDLWYNEDDRFSVSIKRPDNTAEGPFEAPASPDESDDHFFSDMNYYHRGANTEFWGATSWRREVLIDIWGEPGIYTITLHGTTVGSTEDFHAVLNPSRHYNTNKFLTHVVEGYNLNDYTSASKNISPADYVVKNDWIDIDGIPRQITGQGNVGELWSGSSWGPTQSEEPGIDFAACGEVLYAAYSPNTWYSNFSHNILQGGGGAYGIQNAVSAAAPLTTGIIALLLEINPELTADEIKTVLQETATSDEFTGEIPNIQWGHGKINAFAAVEEVMNTIIVDQAVNQSIRIYPNPVSDYLKLELANIENCERIKIVVRNILGVSVINQSYETSGTIKLDVADLPKGTYVVHIRGCARELSSTFVKK